MGNKYWWFDQDDEGDIYIYCATRRDASKEEWRKKTVSGREMPAVSDIEAYDEDSEHVNSIKVSRYYF